MNARAALAAAAVLFAACGAPSPQVAVDHPAPDFRVTNLATGQPVSFAEHYRGQVTLVNIWATYCIPCREEIPTLQSLYQKYGAKGLRIAAVSIDTDSAKNVSAFMQSMGVTFDVLHDPANTIQSAYHSEKLPESFLIDRRGRIVRIDYGAKDWTSEGMQRLVESLLADAPR